jgi:hypothetical protein
MTCKNNFIRSRKNSNKDERMFFVLESDLKNDLREVAQENFVSESQFIRESVRRNINVYRKSIAP